MNIQRDIIYTQRRQVLDGENCSENIKDMIESSCEMLVDTYRQEMNDGTLNKNAFINEAASTLDVTKLKELDKEKPNPDKILEELKEITAQNYANKEKEFAQDIRELERVVLLKVVDSKWMEHIDNMDELKNGIGLRAYGQKNPVDLYRIEGGEMFDEMIAQIKLEVAKIMTHIVKQNSLERKSSVNITDAGLDRSAMNSVNAFGETDIPKNSGSTEKPQPIVNQGPKVGRNDPCPCGSGKKYKQCHGK